MRLLQCLVVISVATAAGRACAQTPTVSFSLSWQEVVALSNTPVPSPNGIIESGEGVRFGLNISFPPVGSLATYQLPAPGGVAPIVAFQSSAFVLNAAQAFGGTWSNLGFLQGFTGIVPQIGLNGSLELCSIGQNYPPSGSSPIPNNPVINVWTAVWTPTTYSARTAAFNLAAPVSAPPSYPYVFVNAGTDPGGNAIYGSARGTANWGQGLSIPIVPAPISGMTWIGAGVCALRRRRF